jgi:uncharacterized protein (DUF1800 family)
MPVGRWKFAVTLLSIGLACAAPPMLAKKKQAASAASDQQRALHALNRLTFGPRSGDVQQVMATGVERWIDLQLHPERIDDSALNARLEPLRTLRMSPQEIAQRFPDHQEINQVMNGKRAMPSDPALRAIYEVQLARLEARRERKQEASASATALAAQTNGTAMQPTAVSKATDSTAMTSTAGDGDSTARSGDAVPTAADPNSEEERARHEKKLDEDLEALQLASLPPDQRYKTILALPTEQLVLVADSLRGGKGKGKDLLEGMTAAQKENLLAMNYPPAVVDSELAQAKLLRAIYSQRQLDEVMTDFWVNHFNVFAGKGLDRVMLTSYERDVIRPHALGKFEDLLVATAKSPAMLFYLDNWLSVGPNSPQALGIPLHPNASYWARPRPKQGKRPTGLNENYGRELLELHTLSVNGGYSQHDVTEVAKVFTGWTIDKPAQGGGFKFDERMHEPGIKLVLGHRVKPAGEEEGLKVLHLLATDPHTAHFISLKLAQRFVSDVPPSALVDRMAKTFLKKKGDIREVLTVLFHSPEFWDETTYRAKVKNPLEFVASAVRATGGEVDDATPLLGRLNQMGMPLYGAQPPTGYSMKAETWVSSSALLNRMNFALALAGGKVKGVELDTDRLLGNDAGADSSAIVSSLESTLVAGGVSQQTHDSIMAQIGAANDNARQKVNYAAQPSYVNMIAGLLLGSPEFQRR